ncbi:MAG: HD-GYP domain-containing protein [Nitrospinales bacterium]
MDLTAGHYRAIRPDFLDKSWRQGCEIFCKSKEDGKVRFLKFAYYDPSSHGRILKMMKADDCRELFIHETDLIRYYEEAVFPKLRSKLDHEKPALQKVEDIYLVARNVLQEYFVNIASAKILRNLNGLMELFEQYLSEGNLGFMDVFGITRKDLHIHTHCANVGLYCMILGIRLKMQSEAVQELGLGGMLFDVGKKEIPQEILTKEGELNEDELRIIRSHPAAGRKILDNMKCYSENILRMAAEHHEQFNGGGYPSKLSQDKISPFAKVCSIMDVFNALTSERPFRRQFSVVETLTIIKGKMAGYFDPKVFVNFIKIMASGS